MSFKVASKNVWLSKVSSALLRRAFLLAILKDIVALYVISSYLATCLIRFQTLTRDVCTRKYAFSYKQRKEHWRPGNCSPATSGGPWPFVRVCASDIIADFRAFVRKLLQLQSCLFLAYFREFLRQSAKMNENQQEKVSRAPLDERSRAATAANSISLFNKNAQKIPEYSSTVINDWAPHASQGCQIDVCLNRW